MSDSRDVSRATMERPVSVPEVAVLLCDRGLLRASRHRSRRLAASR